MNDMYKDFVSALEEYNVNVDDQEMTLKEKNTVGKIWENTLNFLEDRNLTTGEARGALESFDKPLTSMNSNTTLSHVGVEAIMEFCESCDIPTSLQYSAACNMAHILSNEQDASSHFDTGRSGLESLGDKIEFKDFNSVFGGFTATHLTNTSKAALEDFGQDIDKLAADVKINIAITMMKFHKNIIDRVMFRKPCDSNIVQFSVPYNEVFDLEKAANTDSSIRNRGNHRVPFIDLYNTPDIANTESKKVVALKANDTGSVTYMGSSDNELLFGKNINLFDLALDSSSFGHSHVDQTDLVSDGVLFDFAVISITVGGSPDVVEQFKVPLKTRSGARFQLRNNARDSADRNCVISEKIIFNDETTQVDGTPSANLTDITGDAYLVLSLDIDSRINLKTADVMSHGQINGELVTESGDAPAGAATTAFNLLNFALEYYTLDARYNEENMRKTTTAVRMAMRPMAYEIPVGKNYVVDYSLSQVKPTDVLGTVSQAIAIGNDIRSIRLIEATMDQVYDRLEAEKGDSMFQDYRDRVAFDFVAGMKVLPAVWKGEIDLADITSIRTSDILSDIRSLMEKSLLEIFAKIHTLSMYPQALNAGEQPAYKVVTSGPILSTCFSVPHMHDHLNTKVTVDGENIEYARILSDGTRLDVITTTFNTMVDKMLIIPYRKNDPTSELNFGQNCDRGQFVANYTPTIHHGVHRRVAVNSREIVYPTNPVGCMIEVKNISEYFDGLGNLVTST